VSLPFTRLPNRGIGFPPLLKAIGPYWHRCSDSAHPLVQEFTIEIDIRAEATIRIHLTSVM
jgi:hypothetical protein